MKAKTKANTALIKYYVIIAIASFILYGKSINNDFNIDDDYVYENHPLVMKGLSGIPEIFSSRYHDRDEYYFGYRPITRAIYAVEYEFFGMNPHTGHFFNILYYIICCSLLFYVLLKLLKERFKENARWYSFLITIIFTTHAIHTEVVLSLKNREEIICLIFCLVSWLSALSYYDYRKLKHLVISAVSITIAFLSKESAVVFLAIIPLTIVFFKTKIIIFRGFEDKTKSLITKEKPLFITFIITTFFFILLTPVMELVSGVVIYSHNIDLPINSSIPFLIFVIHYAYAIYLRLKNKWRAFNNKTNLIAIWTFCVFLMLFTSFEGSKVYLLLCMLVLFASLEFTRNVEISKPIIVKNIGNIKFLPVALIIFTGALVVVLAYFLPKQSLPEINAPVHTWQNPMFYSESSFSNNAGLIFYSLIYYIKLLIIPYPLRYYYGYKMIPLVDLGNPIVILSIIIHIFLIVYAIRVFNRRSLISFGIFFYIISILPFSNIFFPFTGIVAERVLFIPSIGFSIVLVYLIYQIIGKNQDCIYSKPNVYKSIILAGIFILPNSLITINRNDDWKNRSTLFSTDIQFQENSAKANNVYASHIFGGVQAGIRERVPLKSLEPRVVKAIQYYQRAIEIDSTYSEAWHNLGYVYMLLYREYDLAEYHFSKCLENDSTIAAAYLNRGITNYHLDNFNQAIKDLEDYVNKNKHFKHKQFDKAFVFSGKSYLELGDTANAVLFYRKALDSIKHKNLAPAVLQDMKDFFVSVGVYEEAIELTEMQIEFTPENNQLYVDIGNYYLLSGDTVNAIKGWERAFEHYRGNYSIAMTLKRYFESIGEYEKAEYYSRTANEFRQNNFAQ